LAPAPANVSHHGARCRCSQAGLLLAETEFALQVESDIAAYKGLLMGLFFMTVRCVVYQKTSLLNA